MYVLTETVAKEVSIVTASIFDVTFKELSIPFLRIEWNNCSLSCSAVNPLLAVDIFDDCFEQSAPTLSRDATNPTHW